MIELPIIAFRLDGYDEHICLDIYEVYGFPNEIAYGGGYGVKGLIDICVGSFSVHANHYFTTGELYNFSCQLQKCYDSISGEAVLTNTEHELSLKIIFNKTGKVVIFGEFQECLGSATKLSFEMGTDQTAILSVLRELKNVYNLFGDEEGLMKKN